VSDTLARIRTLYFGAAKATIERDFDEAIDLLKSMATEDERDRAAVYMEGLAQMKSQWAATRRSREASSSPRAAKPPKRSGPSPGGGRRPR